MLIDVPRNNYEQANFISGGDRYAKTKDIEQLAYYGTYGFWSNAKFRSESQFEFEFTKNGAYHNAYTCDCLWFMMPIV
jgi:hypothetical protein